MEELIKNIFFFIPSLLFFLNEDRKIITPRTTQSKLSALIEGYTFLFFLLQNSFLFLDSKTTKGEKRSNNPRMTQLESFVARRLNVSYFFFFFLPDCIRFFSPFLLHFETLFSFHQRSTIFPRFFRSRSLSLSRSRSLSLSRSRSLALALVLSLSLARSERTMARYERGGWRRG